MLNIAICNAGNITINQIDNCISNLCKSEKIPVDIDVFYNESTLVNGYISGNRYDLIFLDIDIEDADIISEVSKIRELDEYVVIICVSNRDRYIIELIQYDIFSFIKEPIDVSILEQTFRKAYKKICNKIFYFQFKFNGRDTKIPCKEILYFESIGRKIHINLINGKQEVFNDKLSMVEAKITGGSIPFLRIHQSYLVNYHMIKEKTKSEVILINGKKLPISEKRQKEFDLNYGRQNQVNLT